MRLDCIDSGGMVVVVGACTLLGRALELGLGLGLELGEGRRIRIL